MSPRCSESAPSCVRDRKWSVQKIPTYVDLDRGDRVGRRCQTADYHAPIAPLRLSRQSQAAAGSNRSDAPGRRFRNGRSAASYPDRLRSQGCQGRLSLYRGKTCANHAERRHRSADLWHFLPSARNSSSAGVGVGRGARSLDRAFASGSAVGPEFPRFLSLPRDSWRLLNQAAMNILQTGQSALSPFCQFSRHQLNVCSLIFRLPSPWRLKITVLTPPHA